MGASPTNGKQHPQIVMALDEWKEFFGCADKYPQTAEFKRRVLLPSIKQINEQKDFILTLEQEKVGRIITHFVISIKDNQKPKKKEFKDPFKDAGTVATFTGTTDKDKIKPSARDRILASSVGVGAIQALVQGQRNVMVGIRNNEVVYVPFIDAIGKRKMIDKRLIRVLDELSI